MKDAELEIGDLGIDWAIEDWRLKIEEELRRKLKDLRRKIES
jgi:hypothetical protein